MSTSSTSDLDRTALEKDLGQQHLSEKDEEFLETSQPHFTAEENEDEEPIDYEAKDGAIGADLAKTESKPSINNIRSVPNGGGKAWLQVLGTFFVFVSIDPWTSG